MSLIFQPVKFWLLACIIWGDLVPGILVAEEGVLAWQCKFEVKDANEPHNEKILAPRSGPQCFWLPALFLRRHRP